MGSEQLTQKAPAALAVVRGDAPAVLGELVGTYRTQDVTEDEVLGMIILGKQPAGKTQSPRPAR